MSKKKEKKYLDIWVDMYHMTVAIFWETDPKEAAEVCKKNGCPMDESVQKEIEDKDDKYAGVCSHIKENGTDIIILLKKKPHTNKEYSSLYHELYHAVEFIREDHGLDGGEASAYLYEFLIEKCNDYLWPKGKNPNLVLSE